MGNQVRSLSLRILCSASMRGINLYFVYWGNRVVLEKYVIIPGLAGVISFCSWFTKKSVTM